MTLRIKLTLASALGGLALSLLVAHWAARGADAAESGKTVALLEELARKFSNDLPSYYTRPESAAQLQAAVVNFGTARITSVLLDKAGQIIAAGPVTTPSNRVKTLIDAIGARHLGVGFGRSVLGDRSYVWSVSEVNGTSYSLILLYSDGSPVSLLPAWLSNAALWPLLALLTAASGWLGFRYGTMHEDNAVLDAALRSQAIHDALTGLPNRALCTDRLRQQIALARRNGQNIAVGHVNLDRFRTINELLGTARGDQLLRMVGQRLQRAVRESDTVARHSGDQFLVLLNNVDENQVLYVAHKIMRSLDESFDVNEHNLFVRGNMGIALYPQHGEDEQLLIQHAEVALRVAKKANTDVIVYNKKHDEYSVRHLALVNDLHAAITQNRFELFYQPKIDVTQRRITAAEVLLRWNHPHHGPVSPDQFIPVAEQTGLIQPLTQSVLNAALRHCAQIHQRGHPITVAVNVSMYNLLESDFDRKVKQLLSTWNVDPQHLELEITESAMMSNPARSKELLVAMDAFGLRLSIDDFGTGYSSLTYLKQLPVDELKVDKSFVLQMEQSDDDAAIVRTIIGLGRDLGLQVVAEGVESAQLLERLRHLGCSVMQGNFLCRPMPFDEFAAWLDSNKNAYASAPRGETAGAETTFAI
jgi:diguanylate cyclase (GGDEF)-like protein